MNRLAVDSNVPPAIVALDRAFGRGGTSELDPTVPAAVWRRALAGPATEFLARPGKQLRAAIVSAGWMLGGGTREPPPGLPLVIELLHSGSLIVDDVEDGSLERRGEPALHQLIGVPLAINTGSWMYFWALAEIAALGVPADIELALHRAAATALVRCHQGQALDLSTRVFELGPEDVPAVVAATTRLKTGTLCRFAAELGATASGARREIVDALGRFGETMGTGLQMLDDLGSIVSPSRRDKGREDLSQQRPTWPWAWLAAHKRFSWARLCELARGGDLDRLADELGHEIGEVGRACVRETLARALDDLVSVVGNNAGTDAIAAELRRMEDSYE